jgi:hypothetical protein
VNSGAEGLVFQIVEIPTKLRFPFTLQSSHFSLSFLERNNEQMNSFMIMSLFHLEMDKRPVRPEETGFCNQNSELMSPTDGIQDFRLMNDIAHPLMENRKRKGWRIFFGKVARKERVMMVVIPWKIDSYE